VDPWVTKLHEGNPEAAWDLFVEQYRRLIFAAIRHYAEDYDDVMDVFARICEALREDDLKRLRHYLEGRRWESRQPRLAALWWSVPWAGGMSGVVSRNS
jgi:hypothetical protein